MMRCVDNICFVRKKRSQSWSQNMSQHNTENFVGFEYKVFHNVNTGQMFRRTCGILWGHYTGVYFLDWQVCWLYIGEWIAVGNM